MPLLRPASSSPRPAPPRPALAGFLCVHEALQAVLPGPQLRPRGHADATFPPASGQGRRVLRPRVLQRGPAQCHGRLRRHPGGHGSRQPALRRGRADQHARRLLRLHPAAHQGERTEGECILSAFVLGLVFDKKCVGLCRRSCSCLLDVSPVTGLFGGRAVGFALSPVVGFAVRSFADLFVSCAFLVSSCRQSISSQWSCLLVDLAVSCSIMSVMPCHSYNVGNAVSYAILSSVMPCLCRCCR